MLKTIMHQYNYLTEQKIHVKKVLQTLLTGKLYMFNQLYSLPTDREAITIQSPTLVLVALYLVFNRWSMATDSI